MKNFVTCNSNLIYFSVILETINLYSVFVLIQLVGGVVHISACIFQLDLVN